MKIKPNQTNQNQSREGFQPNFPDKMSYFFDPSDPYNMDPIYKQLCLDFEHALVVEMGNPDAVNEARLHYSQINEEIISRRRLLQNSPEFIIKCFSGQYYPNPFGYGLKPKIEMILIPIESPMVKNGLHQFVLRLLPFENVMSFKREHIIFIVESITDFILYQPWGRSSNQLDKTTWFIQWVNEFLTELLISQRVDNDSILVSVSKYRQIDIDEICSELLSILTTPTHQPT